VGGEMLTPACPEHGQRTPMVDGATTPHDPLPRRRNRVHGDPHAHGAENGAPATPGSAGRLPHDPAGRRLRAPTIVMAGERGPICSRTTTSRVDHTSTTNASRARRPARGTGATACSSAFGRGET